MSLRGPVGPWQSPRLQGRRLLRRYTPSNDTNMAFSSAVVQQRRMGVSSVKRPGTGDGGPKKRVFPSSVLGLQSNFHFYRRTAAHGISYENNFSIRHFDDQREEKSPRPLTGRFLSRFTRK
jgi:hypothetical protein